MQFTEARILVARVGDEWYSKLNHRKSISWAGEKRHCLYIGEKSFSRFRSLLPLDHPLALINYSLLVPTAASLSESSFPGLFIKFTTFAPAATLHQFACALTGERSLLITARKGVRAHNTR